MTLQRRQFLRAAAAAVGGTAIAGAGAAELLRQPRAEADSTAVANRVIPFHGQWQSGVTTTRQDAASFVSFDVTARTRGELHELMLTLTDRVRFLTSGGRPPELGISAPPADSGVLGPVVPAGGLTVTVSVGSTLFDDRFGLASAKPRMLRPMDTFVNDNLDPTICHGDLLLQVCADQSDTVLHAIRDLTRHTRGGLQPRWRRDGYVAPPRPSGTPRNLLGFKDGIANPTGTEQDSLVWVGKSGREPAWAEGGTYHVVRVIRMLTEFWDRVTLSEQERMIGRRRDSGAPLTGSKETDIPDYSNDPLGGSIPLDAHIRMANPRTAATARNQIFRRGYNYDAGIDSNGNLDMGLIFACYQADLDAGFVTVQKRLADEPLVDYISPVGGGYFFALPGVRDSNDYFARALFA